MRNVGRDGESFEAGSFQLSKKFRDLLKWSIRNKERPAGFESNAHED